jgi:hypothetical protein
LPLGVGPHRCIRLAASCDVGGDFLGELVFGEEGLGLEPVEDVGATQSDLFLLEAGKQEEQLDYLGEFEHSAI